MFHFRSMSIRGEKHLTILDSFFGFAVSMTADGIDWFSSVKRSKPEYWSQKQN